VLKGPSASALYGTAAANGVIVVTTKKGRAGSTRWHVFSEYGQVNDVTTYPANTNGFCSVAAPTPSDPNRRLGWQALLGGSSPAGCDIGTYADPVFEPYDIRLDSLQSFNPLEDPRTSPFTTGLRRTLGLSASGGSEAVTYFLSGNLDDEGGVYTFGVNNVERKSLRANVRGRLRSNADFTLSTGYVNSDARLPYNDNDALGLVSSALLSSRTVYDSVFLGYGFGVTPKQVSNREIRNLVDRLTASLDAHWQPKSWLSLTGQVGIDRVAGSDVSYIPPNVIPYNATFLEGSRSVFRLGSANYTANISATGNTNLSQAIASSTTVGMQYSEELARSTQATGAVLLAGVGSLTGANARFSVNESNAQVRTLGYFVREQLALNDRLFVNAALRADDNSAFGTEFGVVSYPSFGVSWVVAEEPWFPKFSALSTLRLRTAYGTSGLRPGSLDAITYFSPVATRITSTVSAPAFTAGGAGNTNLRPEKSKELEMGFDIGLLDDRVGLEFTAYDKDSEDALISVRTAPSLGVSATRRENLGSVENKGIETLLRARVVESRNFRWDATLQYSRNHNELTELGVGIQPITFGLGGASQRHTPGQPLGAYIARPYTFEDANNDGLINADELTFTSDTSVVVGTPFPTREASFQTSMEFFKVLRIGGLLDYRGGHKNFNSTQEFRCGSFYNCPELYDPATPLVDQAAAIATAYYDSWYGYIEDASFVKLRELSFALGLPQRLADRVGAQGLTLTLAGRNLKTWTDYKGFDPEINFAGTGSNFSTAEFLTQPPVRYWTLRLDVNF
jgi:TonB-dependent starch-binding outer membrane protein SusC